ncbi:TetR/AcrR family transcriptional regulator [Streptomyces sp. 2A115]|uniref:TetR/AcrR family transcriptional regulator n=1 Tax=Streptomyces sp. 2A115 TaxID=3457439 RepID=UPI003FD16D90
MRHADLQGALRRSEGNGESVERRVGRCTQDGDERLLRAELLVALGVGVAVVRSAVGLQPLSDATPDDLIGPLRDVVDILLPPPD